MVGGISSISDNKMHFYACSDVLCYQAWHNSLLSTVIHCSGFSKVMGAAVMQNDGVLME